MSRKLSIGIFIFLILCIAVVFIHNKQVFTNTSQMGNSKSTNSVKSISLPINPKSPNVFNSWVSYVFRASVKEFKKNEEGTGNNYRLLLNTDNKSIPSLMVNNQTQVFKVIDNKLTPAQISDITADLQVDTYASYNIEKNTWSLGRVVILPDQTSNHLGD